MSIEEIYELTDAYLAGSLSEEEGKAFEVRCQNEPAFGQEVRLYIASLGEIQLAGEERLKGQLKNRFSEGNVIPLKPTSGNRPWIIAAAAAVALILVSIWWLTVPSPENLPPTDLYAEYMEVPDVSVTRAPTVDSLAPKWMEALAYLNDSLFQEAIPLLDTLLQDSSFFSKFGGQGVVYLGSALMQEGQFEAALKQFERIDSDNPYSDQIIWYQVLCHMKLDHPTEANKLLSEIGENQFHFKHAQALEILANYPPK